MFDRPADGSAFALLALLAGLAVALSGCAGGFDEPQRAEATGGARIPRVNVAAAADLKFALDELAR